ncbi:MULTISPECIES: VOC family protein [Brevibacterium]|uniref:Glyoxalase-like domain-containing protein n=1 Tax=Brevibacterium antiquum CNRZ 918 TaxID=1255637 RepID=A0A2H1IXB5_9MICO|nr:MULTISPECIES: VOC family protein [Brevibacterium]SMX79770.1 Glyoxalase-like domain-containing protein [Brevibacterium antiquum CNRZ 918]HCG56462.1 VOC family protein [Brevibacterium sp.]
MDDLSTIPANLDHLIITVPELEAGVAEFERLTGVRAIAGGKHPGRGTANCLVGLTPAGWPAGSRTYLEILGPDTQQKPPADGTLPLDAHLAQGLTLQTWAIHPHAFLAKVAGANTEGIDFGEVRDMSRETADGTLLEWRLTSRSPLPGKGTQPFLIDWGESTHPAEAALPSVELLEFSIESPDAEESRRALDVLGAGDTQVVEGTEHRLHARLRGPGGVLEF